MIFVAPPGRHLVAVNASRPMTRQPVISPWGAITMRGLRPCTSADGPPHGGGSTWSSSADDFKVFERHRHLLTMPDTPSGPESATSHPAGMSAQVSSHTYSVRRYLRAMSETPEAYDAIIIGAGVIGARDAHELAGRGWKTLTVDKAALPVPVQPSTRVRLCASATQVEGPTSRGRACTTGRTGRYIGTADDEPGHRLSA